MDSNFQRIGSASNAQVGRDFEEVALKFFANDGVLLTRDFVVPVGASSITKPRKFDLGSDNPPLLVECKSHKWTTGNNIPSAKITVWNEAMYYFQLAPNRYRKVMFVLRDFSEKRHESLAGYYLRNYRHLVPEGVEFWEYDPSSEKAVRIH